jgi:type 1 fimbria pilin
MRVRTAAPIALAVLVAVGPAAHAAPKKKPITKTYDLTLAPAPDASTSSSCSSAALQEGGNMDTETIKVTGAGKLSVKITGFTGDWDMAVLSSSGSMLTEGAGTSTPNTDTNPGEETLKYKSKKAQTLALRVCNFLGTPQATVTYTYTYN